jgi:hypothetical protein
MASVKRLLAKTHRGSGSKGTLKTLLSGTKSNSRPKAYLPVRRSGGPRAR